MGLSDSQESILDLGELSDSGGAFLAEESSEELLEALNVDQQELVFQAQRDDYLEQTKNRYLNREDGGKWRFLHLYRWPFGSCEEPVANGGCPIRFSAI